MNALPTHALSIRQPWCHAIVHGGKRIENRLKWKNSHRRGPLFLHAAAGMTRGEWEDARAFASSRRVPWVPPDPKRLDSETGEPMVLERGGIVGTAKIIGVVRPVRVYGGLIEGRASTWASVERKLTEDEEKWWMGGFALVLQDVQPLPFTPCKGALGFFKVPDAIRKKFET